MSPSQGLPSMLIRFGVSNFMSLHNEQEISLVASSSLKDEQSQTIALTNRRERLLPAAVIYGANAAGKSNLLYALRLMRDIILNSQTKAPPTATLPYKPFLLGEPKGRPTRFDCDFILDDVRYHYGFSYNSSIFLEEWLYAYPSGSRQLWFYRTQEQGFQFKKYLRGKNRAIEEFTRPNSLFLSAAAQNGHPQLLQIYRFFEEMLHFELDTDTHPASVSARFTKEAPDKRLMNFLQFADVGITDVRVETLEPPEGATKFIQSLHSLMSTHFPSENVDTPRVENLVKVSLGHSTASGEPIFLELGDESKGTLRLIELIAPALKVLDRGGTLIVDEIDTSLHTLLAMKILALFGSTRTNTRNAQLIATTHDTNLLCAGLLRRDQIWFAEKDITGATSLYPLTDMQTRNTDNLEKGYLQGRFGAVPFLGPVDKLLEEA